MLLYKCTGYYQVTYHKVNLSISIKLIEFMLIFHRLLRKALDKITEIKSIRENRRFGEYMFKIPSSWHKVTLQYQTQSPCYAIGKKMLPTLVSSDLGKPCWI